MIFEDKNKRRKYFFRYSLGLFSALFIIFIATATLSLIAEPSGKKQPETDFVRNTKNHKRVALAFDDGPDRVGTREVMNILEKNSVPATFFIMGQNIAGNEDILQETYQRGFEIGNHSFTHSHNVHISPERLRWEINATAHLIEKAIGRSTRLYRPPYFLTAGGDVAPGITGKPSAPDQWAKELGYVVVGADSDPKDWQAKTPEEVVQNLNKIFDSGKQQHLVLLHDGYPGLGKTPGALEEIIRHYQKEGYTFVTVGELLGLSRVETMPASAYGVYFSFQEILLDLYVGLLNIFSMGIATFIITLTLVLTLLRLLFVLILYVFASNKNTAFTRFRGTVSVLIPAYNEVLNIEGTIRSILENSRMVNEIIVIDDGSTDGTGDIVRRLALSDSSVKLISILNGGKARALNIGLLRASGEVIIALDADTVFDPEAVGKLVSYFNDEKVGAVAGKIVTTPGETLIGDLQSIEYIVGQNVEKKSLSLLNAVCVVPGAIGAWRATALKEVGGYSTETLAEDRDLTMALLDKGYKIAYCEEALSYTETPQTLSCFIRQRFRWIFGTLQTISKYRTSIFSSKAPSLGFVVMPNLVLFNLLLPLFAVLSDITMVIGIFAGFAQKIIIGYSLFLLFDYLYTSLGFLRERGRWKLLALVPLQGFFYRQIIYYVLIKSVIKALEGTEARWGSVNRSGEAQKFFNKVVSTTPFYLAPETVSVSLQGPKGTSSKDTSLQ